MPYVKQEGRPDLDKIVDLMFETGVYANGDLNYILFSYFCRLMLSNTGPSYGRIKNFRAELKEVSDHIHERFLARWEQRKRQENGDVPGAKELFNLMRD